MSRFKLLTDKSGSTSTIGIILTVAILVIVASIIAAYSFGMLHYGTVIHYDIVLTANRINTNDIVITLAGGPDADKLADVNPYSVKVNSVEATLPPTFNKNVGSSATVHGPYKSNVVVVCHFNDGIDQVVMLGDL